MKKIITSILCVGAFCAHADDYLLKKTTGGGFVIPELAETETCKVYETKGSDKYRVVIKRSFGDLVSTYSEFVHVPNLESKIQTASTEPIVTKTNNICDAPTTTYSAQLPGSIPEYTIFYTGTCGSDEIDRQGPASSNLKSFIDQFCPRTFDFDLP